MTTRSSLNERRWKLVMSSSEVDLIEKKQKLCRGNGFELVESEPDKFKLIDDSEGLVVLAAWRAERGSCQSRGVTCQLRCFT